MNREESLVRWPAEWEKQESVWMSWPDRKDLWQGGIERMHEALTSVIAAIVPAAPLSLNATAALHPFIAKKLAAAGVDLSRVRFFDHPVNDVWCRDHGGIFVKNRQSGALALRDWQFNSWGGKFAPWDLDNQIPARMASSLTLPYESSSLILEGGAIEGNGADLLITTEAVLLNENRNPQWSKAQIEDEIRRMLGVKEVFWLGEGIEGDDTDGHVDDMVRFCQEDALLAIREKNSSSPNYRVLEENWERLADIRTVSGGKIERLELPMPEPLRAADWRLEQLPASYANFLIVNDRVLVPIFAQESCDGRALGIISEAFPRHEVVGVDARHLVFEGGAIHCITQQQPC